MLFLLRSNLAIDLDKRLIVFLRSIVFLQVCPDVPMFEKFVRMFETFVPMFEKFVRMFETFVPMFETFVPNQARNSSGPLPGSPKKTPRESIIGSLVPTLIHKPHIFHGVQ